MPEFGAANLAVVVIAGSAVGFISGVFGVGGGFLIVPVLHIGMGVPIEMAVGSAACQVLGPATTSLVARRLSRENLRLPLIISGGITVGVLAGAALLKAMTHRAGDSRGSETANIVVLSAYCLLLVTLGVFSLWEVQRELANRPIRTGWIAQWSIPPLVRLPEIASGAVSVPVIAWFGLAIGFLSGLLGISGGVLLLAGLIYLLGLSWRFAVTHSMTIVWLIALQSTIAHAWHSHVQLPMVAALLVGGTVGARLGVHLGAEVTPVRGRRAFGWLALATAAVIALKLGTLLNAPGW